MSEEVKIDPALIAEFECPVCFKYFQPPIRQCQQGHCFCGDCFKKIRKCSICRSPKSDARCFVLERMHALLVFPCKHSEEGCLFSGKWNALRTHQITCKFACTPCPLRFNNCEWRGHKRDLIPHCDLVHRDNTYSHDEQKLLVTNFRTLTDRHYYILFDVYEHLFRCTWDLSRITGTLRFAVYILGEAKADSHFSYRITMYKPHNKATVVLSAPCYVLSDDSKIFLEDKYLCATHCMVKDLCDEDGSFNYEIKIINNYC